MHHPNKLGRKPSVTFKAESAANEDFPVLATTPSVTFPPRSRLGHLLVLLQAVLDRLQTCDLATPKPPRRAVRVKSGCGMTGDGPSQFWARQNPNDPAWDPTFPSSFKLGNSPRSATVWFADEIEAWLESRARVTRRHPQSGGDFRGRKFAPSNAGSSVEVTP